MAVYIRPVEQEDLPNILQSSTNPTIRFLTGTTATFSLEQLQHHFDKAKHDDTRFDFVICLNQTGEIVGEGAILDIDYDNRSAAFRLALSHQNHFNQGYGSQTIRIILAIVFYEYQLYRLQLEVYSHNPRAIATYEKLGFKREGVLRQALYYDGTFYDEIVMAMLKDDYLKKS
ncbi:RimJ/RimL family protein N-acetyltransferase [Alkalibacillus flavidus]|uniref:RimJ/RimL family protein N-acetyltransferase n=1 Tax=Alkalibacillus flavidus TaxID=546021 RepID=A0ABV2KU17_9BACI